MPIYAEPASTARPSAGAVPAAYIALLTRRWTWDMPPALRRSRFFVLLHVAHDLADPLGQLRALDDGDVVEDLARGACLSLAGAVRHLAAASAAGVLVQRGPGQYALVTSAVPDWSAALAHLADPTL